MIIRNQENKEIAINTDLVSNYFKEKKHRTFQIWFGYAATNEETYLYDVWEFKAEEDRDDTYENIMSALGGRWL